MQRPDFATLIARQQAHWSLEQAFYISPEIYEFERTGWLAQQWFVMGHGSEVNEPGRFIVRELLGESLIIVRDADRVLRAFYNVCRHRGSRICDEDGMAASLVCPYHAWSYRLDGTLRSRGLAREPLEHAASVGLGQVRIADVGGLILCSLEGDPDAVASMRSTFEAGLRYHGIPDARIAARQVYPTRGNWKLVLENFLECYHCPQAHPEYCGVMKWVGAMARGSSQASDWSRSVTEWSTVTADADCPVKAASWSERTDTASKTRLYPSQLTEAQCVAFRLPIGGGRVTQSKSGEPVAPLMGQSARFDGGVTHFVARPFVTLMALNDHAVLFQFLPTGAESTDVVVTWLVDAVARPEEIDTERMRWLWDITTLQDKALVERNALGVRSRAYRPGPYGDYEDLTAEFVSHYLTSQASILAGQQP